MKMAASRSQGLSAASRDWIEGCWLKSDGITRILRIRNLDFSS